MGSSDDKPVKRIREVHHSLKIAGVIVAEVVLLGIIGLSFWFQDLRYSLPTPQPSGWKAPKIGTNLSAGLYSNPVGNVRPTLFNFYNCDCPCSRFNLDHVRQLSKQFGATVKFVIVLESGTVKEEQEVFKGLKLRATPYFDSDGKLARSLGVYATPQAVLTDSHERLVYRGNYNVSRYCNDPRTEFVRLALESVTACQPLPALVKSSIPAYGCAIPTLMDPQNEGKS